MRASALVVALGIGAAAGASEAPLSAIDWLTESVVLPDASGPGLPGVSPPGISPGAIVVAPLDQPDADSAGLLSPALTGLPEDLWGPATVEDVLARIAAVPREIDPALTRLFTTLLLAETKAPAGSGADDALLLARTERLLRMGALDRAAALLERAGISSAERFHLYFDIALLKGQEQPACALLRGRPDISPTYPERIFCLARNGDWSAAAVTLETATSLGILAPEEDLLLARFLDPEILADDSLPPVADTPLTFRLREAIGEPVPTTTLSLAFAWSDLRPTRGWKAQIEAAERLARAGSLSPNLLLGVYLRQAPSASGGVWDRVAAVQALDKALSRGSSQAAVEAALVPAWDALRQAGLHHALAHQYGADLAARGLTGRAGEIALHLGLLSPEYEDVALNAAPAEGGDRFLLALARGVPETAVATDAPSLAVRQGFVAAAPAEQTQRLLDDARTGEAMLRAITLFSDGASGDLDGVSEAIATLRALGLDAAARRAALDLLLGQSPG